MKITGTKHETVDITISDSEFDELLFKRLYKLLDWDESWYYDAESGNIISEIEEYYISAVVTAKIPIRKATEHDIFVDTMLNTIHRASTSKNKEKI